LRGENNDRAVPLLERLTAAEPRDASAHVDLAAAYAVTGNREGAERQFQEALRLDPGSASALMGLANLYLKQGGEGGAVSFLRKVAATAPKAYEPPFLLGSAFNRLGRAAEAVAELETALRLGGDESAEVHYHLARAYGSVGRQDDRRRELARF